MDGHDRILCGEDVAMICHEANRALCLTHGDTSQAAWADAPQWQRDSACNGVRFALENPDAPPSASHENWMQVKEEEGWCYGEVKDAVARTHPCMVPYDDLPAEQRAKDHVFQGIVRALAPFIAR